MFGGWRLGMMVWGVGCGVQEYSEIRVVLGLKV